MTVTKNSRLLSAFVILLQLMLLELVLVSPLASAAKIDYSYNERGQLIRVDYGSGKVICYAYDAAGNRISTMCGTAIQVTQSILNFGYVAPGSYKDLTLEVKNIGGGILTGTVSATAPFSIVSVGTYSLGPGQSQVIVVRYTAPLQEGSQTGSLTFTGGAGLTVQVKGTNQKGGLPWLLLLLGN